MWLNSPSSVHTVGGIIGAIGGKVPKERKRERERRAI